MHGAMVGVPLLLLHLYEHSFRMGSGPAAARYVEAFMRNVNRKRGQLPLVRALRMVKA